MGKMTSEIKRKINSYQRRMDRVGGEVNIEDRRRIARRVVRKYRIRNFFAKIFIPSKRRK